MRKLLTLLLFALLTTTANAQFRLASDGFVFNTSVVNDSTFIVDVNLFADLTGSGYIPTNIIVGYRMFSQRGQLYSINAIANATFSSATFTIIEVDNAQINTEGLPIGQVQIYDPGTVEAIPQVPFGTTGATAVLQAAVVSYNSILPGGSEAVVDLALVRGIVNDSVSVERAARVIAQQAAEDYADANDDTRDYFHIPTASFRKYYDDSSFVLVSEETVSGKGVEGVTSINGTPHIVTSSGDIYKVPNATGPEGIQSFAGSLDIRFPYSHSGTPYINSGTTVTVGDTAATIGDRAFFSFTTDGSSFPAFSGAELTNMLPINDFSQLFTARFLFDGLTTWYDVQGRNKELTYTFNGTAGEPDWETVTEGTGRTFTDADGYIAGVAISPTGSDSRGVRYQNRVEVANADVLFRAEKTSGTGSAGVIFYDEDTGDWFGVITSNSSTSTAIQGYSSTLEFNSLSNRPFDKDRNIRIFFDGTNVTIDTQTTDDSADYTTIINNVAISSPRSNYKVGMYVGATADIELRLHSMEFLRYEK